MKRKNTTLLSIILAGVLTFSLAVSAAPAAYADTPSVETLYVRANYVADVGSNGEGSVGHSWGLPFTDLQDALEEAESLQGDVDGLVVEIWVAAGTYLPTSDYGMGEYLGANPRWNHFELLNNVTIYGGFPADGGTMAERNWEVNVTILSGDIGAAWDSSDNCYHVVAGFGGLDNTAVLDGFIVTDGYANHASGPHNSGGGFFFYGCSPIIRNTTICDNYGHDGGGMGLDWECNLTLSNVKFRDNTAAHGGGIKVHDSSPILNNVEFTGNIITGSGGGIFSHGYSTVTLDHCLFTGNSADWVGGGIYSEHSTAILTNTTFTENYSGNGGGIYSNWSDLHMTGVTFTGNWAEAEYLYYGYGGALYIVGPFAEFAPRAEDSQPPVQTFTDVTFTGNTAQANGGALYMMNVDVVLDGAEFSGNEAGVHLTSQVSEGEGSGEMSICEDDPEGFGGAICNEGNLTVVGADFDANFAAENGGAIYSVHDVYTTELQPAFLNIESTVFAGNEALGAGGAVFCDDVNIVNSVFDCNQAQAGGGLFFSNSANVINTTFSANRAVYSGGGIYAYWLAEFNTQDIAPTTAPESLLANVILWGNEAQEFGAQIYNADCDPDIIHSLIQGALPDGDWDEDLGTNLGGNIDANPRFVLNSSWGEGRPVYGNLRLRSDSPARDNGHTPAIDGYSTDLDGNPRVVRGTVDMGAYEYQLPVTPQPQPVPIPEPELRRLGGEDRFGTAVEVSKAGWETATMVILARADDYADALTGVPLAFLKDAPILLTKTDSLPAITKVEIQRLGAAKAMILGGPAAVSKTVENELRTMGLTVERVYGSNRFGTAAKIADLIAPDGNSQVALANGWDFPDALSVAPYAAKLGMPILLTTTGTVPAETLIALNELDADEVFIIGGTAVISAESVAGVSGAVRIKDTDRYGTAIELANYFNPAADRIFVATGLKFPDCLTGAVLAAKEDCGILLVGSSIPASVAEYLAGKSIMYFTVLGGTAAVSAAIASQLIN